jgi:quinol monooxygenase YgiN
MVQIILRLRTKAAGATELSRALRIVMLPAQRDRACVGARLYVEVGEPDSLYYSEEWLTAEDLAREVQSPRFGRLLELMETAAEPPDLQFRFVAETRGLDYVAEVRGAQHPSAA